MAMTHVTGTLVDSQSTVWTNALIKVTFVLPANNPNPAIWSDGAFNHGPITLMTDDSGHFAIDLPSTTSITPANSTWLFNIGPNASAQAVNLNIGVTGASMDISSLFTANAGVLLVQSLEIPRAYGAFELETPVNMGQIWFNVTTGVFQFWNGTIWDVFGDATGDVGIGFPPPGIAVSAGNAWGAPFPMTDNGTTTTMSNELAVTRNCLGATTSAGQGLKITWNLSNGSGETDFINSNAGTGGGFRWFNVTSGSSLTNVTPAVMTLDNTNSLHVVGVITGTGLALTGSAPFLANTAAISFVSGSTFIDSVGADPATGGQFDFRTLSSNAAININVLTIDAAGNAHFAGTLTSGGTKAFLIPHPFIADKDLVHACLEGPENGVYYRGEVITKSGHAVVTLPDYFEALTFKEDRSVLLTVIATEDNPVFGGQVAASRVIDGRFVVFSSDDSVTVSWEVKAVRRIGVERLSVIRDKFESKGIVNA